MTASAIASILAEASLALMIAAAGATIWCAFVPPSDAVSRRRIWIAVLATPGILLIWRVIQDFSGIQVATTRITLRSPDAVRAAMILWFGGVLALGTRLIARLFMLRAWSTTLANHTSAVIRETRKLAREIDAGEIRVVRGETGAMPLCWGVFKPTLCLPADAAEWPADLLAAVTLHEYAHLRQGDQRLGPLVELLSAFFWFHPAMWIAARRVHVDSERACDEFVVSRGIDPEHYARQLLAIARTFAKRPAVPAAALLGRADLEERVAGLLMAIPGESGARKVWRTLHVATAIAIVVAITPNLTLREAARSSDTTFIPGSDPGSFGVTLFGRE